MKPSIEVFRRTEEMWTTRRQWKSIFNVYDLFFITKKKVYTTAFVSREVVILQTNDFSRTFRGTGFRLKYWRILFQSFLKAVEE